VEASVARSALETEMDAEFEENTVGAKVFESAGGFLSHGRNSGCGARLIHVNGEPVRTVEARWRLSRLRFVATVYGVGTANLLFLPIANKLKRRLAIEKERKTMITEGVLAIQEGLNPPRARREAEGVPGWACAAGSGESE